MSSKKIISLTLILSFIVLAAIFIYSKFSVLNNTPTTNQTQNSQSIEHQLESLSQWYIQKPLPASLNPFGECSIPDINKPVAKYISLTTNSNINVSDLYSQITDSLNSSDWKQIDCKDDTSFTYEKDGKALRLLRPNGDTSVTVYLQY